MIQLIDSHCHIDFPVFDEDRATILADCARLGMGAIVVPGVSCSQWSRMKQVLDLFSPYKSGVVPNLLPAYGLHPCFMVEHTAEHIDRLDGVLEQGAVAVGEIGLDTFSGSADLPAQLTIFKRQLAIAKNHQLPVIIHSRKTQDLVIKLIRESGLQTGGIMHAFSGSLQQAQRAIELGFLIGFGGAATYDRANRLRSLLRALPLEAIVFETDAPDIPPCFDRKSANSPVNLFKIVEILAEVRQQPVETLWRCSSNNLINLLKISG